MKALAIGENSGMMTNPANIDSMIKTTLHVYILSTFFCKCIIFVICPTITLATILLTASSVLSSKVNLLFEYIDTL